MTDWDVAVTSMAGALGRDLRAALAEVALAQERPYYDAEADLAASEAYYAKVSLDRLGDLVASTHTTKPGYKPAIELYPWVDLQPDGKLRSLYTAQVFEPEDLIRADFEALQARVSRLMQATTMDESDQARIQAEVEAALPFNCEHVVPQSWFAKAEPMRGDLHHLFACESRCNSFRGNTPFAEFADFPLQPTTSGLRATEHDTPAGPLGISHLGIPNRPVNTAIPTDHQRSARSSRGLVSRRFCGSAVMAFPDKVTDCL